MRPIDADALVARLEDDARHMEMPVAQMYTYGAINDIKKEPTVAVVPQWISCSERLPEEDFCSGRSVQYSETVLVTVANNGDDDDTFVDVACTADGVWQLNYPQDTSPLIPKWCKVIAWMPLPEPCPYKEGQE